MSKCYNCRYFRPSDGKCGYNGYSRSVNDDCTIAEHRADNLRCCGNCKYYRTDDKRCVRSNDRQDPWHECGRYEHDRA